MPPAFSFYENYHNQDSNSESEEEQNPQLITWKKDLARGLNAIQSFGDFASQKNYSQFVNPCLEIADCLIPLPLVSLFAEQIKFVSRPAPFGRGDETVVDSSVRLTWELNHDEFRITNTAWSGFLDTIKQDAARNLGLSPADINVELYKLLLYEKGSFFKRHKDSEKAPGMIGSLIICLPSKHEGGEVHLSHAGKDHVYSTAPNSAFDLTALAWYSDVTHEVKEVTEGHRLVLTYNIVQRAGAGKSAGFFVQQQTKLKERISRWPREFPDISRLVYFFDHQYSQTSLSPDNLKGRDRAVFDVLQQLSSEAGFYLLLGNVTKREYDFDDGDMEEEEGISLDYLCAPDGKKIASDLDMSQKDIIGSDPYRNRSADSEDEGEFTGNESTPTLFKYHNSVMVLVPRNKLQDFIKLGADPWALLTMVMDTFGKHPKDTGVRRHVLKVMHKILDSHRPATNRYGHVPTELASWKAIRMTILTVGWKFRDIPLYCKAIQSCTAGGVVPGDLVTKLATLINDLPSTPQPSDWDQCLGGLLDCPVDLTRLFTALSDFEKLLEEETSKESFKTWVTPIRRTKFESKPSLTREDHGFIVDLVSTLLIPKLHQTEDKDLIGRLIGTLAGKGRGNTLPGAEAIAEQILDAELPRLHLGPLNWWQYTHQKEGAEVERFVNLVKVCLKSGFVAQAAELIRNLDHVQQRGWAKPQTLFVGSFVPNVAHQFVRDLGNLLNEHQAPFMESVRDLFENLLRNYALAPFPVYPVRGAGWTYRRRGCGVDACEHCRKLDNFLVSPLQQRAEFAVAKHSRDHIARQLLDGNLFKCSTDTRRRPHTLIVTKRSQDGEYRSALAMYRHNVDALRCRTDDFRHEHFRKILGDGLYKELILLEGPLDPSVPDASAQQAAGPGGTKREADDELGIPPALRRRLE
ncbi:hypothetical protein VM1G_00844 [Cytospora mali]|uniref:Prolyl 4-hydroxylase alpha subunit Fe(2+) 2OG dioxygenase domain-containing protein n=1 Tax=Cytospora mali TaxID=578113 RepID=A0A194VLX9_CYTMA|nr:hypothetical protein VM1G_00844 [Valsa mali]